MDWVEASKQWKIRKKNIGFLESAIRKTRLFLLGRKTTRPKTHTVGDTDHNKVLSSQITVKFCELWWLMCTFCWSGSKFILEERVSAKKIVWIEKSDKQVVEKAATTNDNKTDKWKKDSVERETREMISEEGVWNKHDFIIDDLRGNKCGLSVR